LLLQVATAQDTLKFFVAGHAYGKPGVDNVGFHPSFQSYMNQNHLQFDFGFLTGDFIIQPTEKNWNEVDSVVARWSPKMHFVAGNHDFGKGVIFEERSGGANRAFVQNNSLFVILNLTNTGWLIRESQWELIHQGLNNSESTVNQIFILTHQVAFANSGPLFKKVHPNSFDGSAGELKFFELNLENFKALELPTYFIAGDVGAISGRSGSSYHQVENLHLITSGMGNMETDNFLSIQVNQNSVKISKVNLLTSETCPLSEELIRISKE
jgi:hypothetical protein